ncbi:MAG: autotransporter outer membrane beta-barrel domain-containing protein, partial [Comamonas sp.]
HAQTITFSGDSTPIGSMGANYSTQGITVGNTNTGALSVLSGAVLSNTRDTFIGAAAGSSGTATISDSAIWNSATMSVGRFGSGVLNISNGGKLVSANGYIGRLAGSSGTATVDGPESSWTIPIVYDSDFWIGNNGGSGTLRVLNGATVSTTSEIYSAINSIPTSPDSATTALIEVDGANSNLMALTRCMLGASGISTMRITNGGSVSCGTDSSLVFGTASLSGANSKWVLGANLDIGDRTNLSDGAVSIGESSTVEVARSLRLPNVVNAAATGTGTINIEGTTTPGVVSAESLVFGPNRRGTLNFNHTDASGNYQFATPVSGPGQVNVNNSGTTLLSGNNHYSGTTSVNAGVLRAGSATGLSNASDFVVASGGTLDMHTYSPTLNSLANAGVVTLLSGGSNAVLTVANHYSGNGGAVRLNTVLEADDSATERLVINGDSSGTTTLNIHNLGGAGAQTTGNGILVVQVAGASNGTFSLPAPGYVEAGGFHYVLVKAGNNWYLQTETRAEALAPEASVSCTPAELTDTENQVSSCTVSLNAPAASDFSINLNVPAASPRYTTTCTSPMLIAANASQASCTITATPNTTANDGDVLVELSIAPPTVADAYTVAGPAAQVLIKDAGATRAAPTPVPSLGALGLASLASLMAVLGMRRTRKPTERRA